MIRKHNSSKTREDDMDSGSLPWTWLTVGVTAGVSVITAVLSAYLTARFTRRREWEADWRRLKFSRYQEFFDSLSQIMEGRSTKDTIIRFHDAANSIQLVAPKRVLEALWRFIDDNSYKNPARTTSLSDEALDILVRAMRRDLQPVKEVEPQRQFWFIRPPPDINAP